MTLSADQRAILELLLRRGADYDSIGAVLGADAADARDRAHAALAALTDADEIDPSLAEFLLGRADPAEASATERRLAADADANALARRIATGLRDEIAGAEPPPIPEPPAGGRASRDGTLAAIARIRRSPAQLLAWTGAVALLILATVLIATGAFSGDEAEPAADDATTTEGAEAPTRVRIPLRAAGGAAGSGQAVIALDADFVPFLTLDLRGVKPAPSGQLHMLWITVADGHGIPLPTPIAIDGDDSFHQRVKLPVDLLAVLDAGEALEVIVVSADELRQLQRDLPAPEEGASIGLKDLPDHPGGTVLTGPIPSSARAQSGG